MLLLYSFYHYVSLGFSLFLQFMTLSEKVKYITQFIIYA